QVGTQRDCPARFGFDPATRFRHGIAIAAVKEKCVIGASEFLGNRATDAAARPRDEVTLHGNKQTSNVRRSTSNFELKRPQMHTASWNRRCSHGARSPRWAVPRVCKLRRLDRATRLQRGIS